MGKSGVCLYTKYKKKDKNRVAFEWCIYNMLFAIVFDPYLPRGSIERIVILVQIKFQSWNYRSVSLRNFSINPVAFRCPYVNGIPVSTTMTSYAIPRAAYFY